MSGWTGVDLDATLALYERGTAVPGEVGEPIPEMVTRVKNWIASGKEVRIFTARAYPINKHVLASWPEAKLDDMEDTYLEACKKELDRHKVRSAFRNVRAIREWTRKHIGKQLTVTNVKDPKMDVFYDDKAITVAENTGKILTRKTK